jgi:hypothetical protein
MAIVELEQEVCTSHGSTHAILSDDLKMRRGSAITHRASHRLLCSNSSPTTVLSGFRSEWHLIVPYSENGRQGRVSQPWSTSNRMRRPNSGKLQTNPSSGASNNGRIDGAGICLFGWLFVCVCARARARILLWRWLGKRCHMSYHYSAIPHFRELFDSPSYMRQLVRERLVGCRRAWMEWPFHPDPLTVD